MENNGRRGVGSLANMVQYRVNRSFLVNDLEVVVRCFRCDFEASIGLVRREKFDLRVDRATCFGSKSEFVITKRKEAYSLLVVIFNSVSLPEGSFTMVT